MKKVKDDMGCLQLESCNGRQILNLYNPPSDLVINEVLHYGPGSQRSPNAPLSLGCDIHPCALQVHLCCLQVFRLNNKPCFAYVGIITYLLTICVKRVFHHPQPASL